MRKRIIVFIVLFIISIGLFSCSKGEVEVLETYRITWEDYDGTLLEIGFFSEGKMPTFNSQTPVREEADGYSYQFSGWTPEVEVVTAEKTYRATYSSTWLYTVYEIEYHLDGGVNSIDNPESYKSGNSLTFKEPSKTGYTFAGWFDDKNEEITGITDKTIGNLSLTAHWTANKNELTVISENDLKGKVKITAGSGYSDESITVVATLGMATIFAGWYHEKTKVSEDLTYTFTMPTNDYSLVAEFNYDRDLAIKSGVKPSISIDGNTATYGLYPQTNVNDSNLIKQLNKLTTPDENGWYFYNGNYYAKLTATPRSNKYTFKNGETIVADTTYWFLCEPIVWDVLDNNNGNYYLLSSYLLDAGCYYNLEEEERVEEGYQVFPNNYAYSDIRTWLNDDFYNTAFSLNNSYVLETEIDNSADSANCTGKYAWYDTTEKVFLPSYADYVNSDYGFIVSRDSSSTRYCQVTDWAKARGAYYGTIYHIGNGSYWLRSPYGLKDGSYAVWVVNTTGGIGFDGPEYTGDCIRPAIILKY